MESDLSYNADNIKSRIRGNLQARGSSLWYLGISFRETKKVEYIGDWVKVKY